MEKKIRVTLTVNGERRTMRAAADTPLLWVLREDLKLTGTKYGCGLGQCGACTVHIDGSPNYACLNPIYNVLARMAPSQGCPSHRPAAS